MSRSYEEFIQAIMSNIECVTESGCWIYHGRLTVDGYGISWFNGKNVRVHRALYEEKYGKLPDGLVSDHLCRVRCCCNPYHIEQVENFTNILRGNSNPVADNAKKTHCKNGHPFDRIRPYGRQGGTRRVCARCEIAGLRARRARRKLQNETAG